MRELLLGAYLVFSGELPTGEERESERETGSKRMLLFFPRTMTFPGTRVAEKIFAIRCSNLKVKKNAIHFRTLKSLTKDF